MITALGMSATPNRLNRRSFRASVNYTRPYPVNTSIVPSPSNSAVTEDPAESGMGAVKPPENTVHPAFSTSPRSAN